MVTEFRQRIDEGTPYLIETDGESVVAIDALSAETTFSAVVTREIEDEGSEKLITLLFQDDELTSPEDYTYRIDSKIYHPWEILLHGGIYQVWLYHEGVTVTYWAPDEESDNYGLRTWATPTQIKGTWMESNELFRDQRGRETTSKAIVRVNSDVALGGYLYQGTSATADPTTVDGSIEIKGFDKMPNRDSSAYLRKAYL